MKRLLLLAALPCALLAQTMEGTWQGTVAPNQNVEIRMVFKIARNGDSYQGTLYNLAANRQQNLGAITLQGNAVKIAIPAVGATYEGKIETDGNSITGTLTQGTNPLPLALKRATSETAWELPPPSSGPPKPLPEGTKLEFVVATIKPSAAPAQGPGFNVTDLDLRARSVSLANLFTFAYNLHPAQITGLPGWALTEGYEIVAALPSGGDATDAQILAMLQNLIKSRFNVSFHIEKRELSVYTITIGKDGPAGLKLVKNTTNGARVGTQGLGRVFFSGVTMANFAGQLQQRVLDRPVLDRTGLTDRYDFTLNWTPDEFQFPAVSAAQRAAAIAAAGGLPDLFTAFQEQLGLKLDATKAPADVFVIDNASRPSEN